MAATVPSRRFASRRVHFVLVRCATLFVIAAAAIASCESSKERPDDDIATQRHPESAIPVDKAVF